MNRIILALLLTLTTACGRQNTGTTDEEGTGTRGGGDVCELDYSAHLQNAKIWLTESGQQWLSQDEKTKVAPLNQAWLKSVQIECLTEKIVVNGIPKTAYSQSLRSGGFHTQIDANRWFGTNSHSDRTATAIHEILVMLGLEFTADYHISRNYSGDDAYILPQSIACSKSISKTHTLALSIVAHNDERGFIRYTATLNLTGAPGPVVISEMLNCDFAENQMLLVTCYEPKGENTGQNEIALEIVNSAGGQELRVHWDNLATPKATVAAATKAMNFFSPFSGTPRVDEIFSFNLVTTGIDRPLDEVGSARCTVIE